ncbi:carbohydrate ABC transporter permease [Archangium sp.]|uniref:carbohydrate ABC transporter permease n=1 Tax=Archangium sp. TaxID=1872627 RepID=UPI002D484A4F|nr:carbohydrate ABC transporter permease [Archangium sp.]HYO56994.1 carbohydrate ABC transporter permease [Archangium sp.]
MKAGRPWLSRLARRGPLHLGLLLIALCWLMPSVGLLVTSLRPRGEIASSGWWTVIASPDLTLGNYGEVLGTRGMVDSFVNSLLIAVPSTLLPVLIGALAAYAFTWLRFPGRDGLFVLVVALMVIPIQMTFVPVLRLLNPLGLTQSYVGIWLAHTAFGLPLVIFLLRGFFALMPLELIEAARLDGASEPGIFARIVLPLSVPALASLTILQFLAVWNDLLMALVFVQSPEALPLTVRLSQLLSTYGTEWHLLSAGAFVLMAVPLVVFFSLQRYFTEGLVAGAMK